MNARHILLTHFSQRFSKFVAFDHVVQDNGLVGCAYDLMNIPLEIFWKTHHAVPIANTLLVDTDAEHENAAERERNQIKKTKANNVKKRKRTM